MVFNNSNFESGIKTSLNSLKNLDEKLKMNNSAKGLDGISKAASKVNLSGLSSGVETVTAKFSALGVMGATVLANITNSAVNAGKNLAKALTIEPITDGFREYETKMGAIQTILTNTAHQGTTLKDVTKTLNELNEYADKTIYNFAEMTKNIGTFTAAGVDLDTSTAAIKGIANLAAASGSTSAQASSAMYQLSQALATGKVSLQDWNSVVNAGMGGKLFQDALIRTSEVMGTGADAAIKKYGSFRESLTKGEWLTGDVLTETLKQISGAYTEAELKAQGYSDAQAKAIVQLANNATKAATEVKTVTQLFDTMKESVGSGWAQTWEYIIGDKDQATKMLTSVSDAFNKLIQPSTDARNAMFKFWNENGGRDDVIKGMSNMFTSLGKGLGAVKDAFRDIFPPMTGKKLVEISKGFKNLTEKFKMSDSTAGKIKSTFKGLFSIFSLGGKAVGALFKALSPVGTLLGGFGNVLLTVTSGIGNFISKINEAAEKSNIFGKISDGIKNAFSSIGNVLGGAAKAVGSFFKSMPKMDFSKVFGSIGDFMKGIGSGLSPIIEGIGNALGSINFGTLIGGLNVLLAGGLIKTIKKGFESLTDTMSDFTGIFDSVKEIAGSVSDILDGARKSLEAYQNNLNASTLLKIAGAVGILAAALLVVASIDPGRLENALAGVATLFLELTGSMALMLKVLDAKKLKGIVKASSSLLILSGAVLVLSFAMKQLSGLSWEELAKGLTGVAASLVLLIASAKLMSGKSKGLIKAATSMIIFAVAIRAMAEAVKAFGKIDPDTMSGGIFAMALVLTELVAFAKLMKNLKFGVGDSVGILVLAGALNVLALAVNAFGSMKVDALQQGLGGIGLILAELALFSKLGTASGGMITTAIGLTILSGAMYILSGAIKSLGSIKWEELKIGLTSMAGALTIIGVAAALMPKTMGITAIGIGLMAGALLVLSSALQSLGSQSWEQVAISLVSLAGALTILGVAMYAMSKCLVGAAAMVVMAGALALLTPQLIALGNMSLAQVGTSLLMLAGAFTVIGLAGLVLAPVIPALLGLSVAIGLLSLACVGIGVGLLAFGTGLTMVAAVVTGSGFAILNFVKGLIELLPLLGSKLAEAIINLVTGIAEGVPQIMSAMTQLITGILKALTDCIPQIITTATALVVALGTAIGNAAPKLITVGVNLFLALLKGISKNIAKIVKVGSDIVVKFLNAVGNNLGKVIQAGIDLALKFINGVADGIRNNGPKLESAIKNLIDAVIKTGIGVITGAIGQFVKSGVELIAGFIRGIGQKVGEVKTKISGMIGSAKGAASRAGTALVSAGRNLIAGFLSGIQEKARAVREKISSIASGLADAARNALGIHSPSRVFMEIGRYTVEGLAVGLNKYAKAVNKPADKLAQMAINSATKPLAALGKALSSDIDSTPVIRPVLDLSNVESGTNRLNNLLSNRTMSIAGVSGGISKSIGSVQNGVTNAEVVSAIKDLKNEIGNTNNTTYQINGITYDDGSNITNAVETLVRAAKMERRI